MKVKMMKTYKLQITEEELIALIEYNTRKLRNQTYLVSEKPSTETAQRIVDLTRRLNKDTLEIEVEVSNKAQVKIPDGWT